MKFYQAAKAPNPRRARMFMAEKGVNFDAIEFIELDLMAGDNLADSYREKNPMQGVPLLELDDGHCIAESMAISRYFECLHPDPPLMGADPLAQAQIEMWNRRMELNLLLPVAMAFRHTTGHFKDREAVHPDYGRSMFDNAVKAFAFLDTHLKDSDFIAGDTFSVADITALCSVDFARVIRLRIDADQTHLQRWYARVSSRPSASA